MGAGGRVPLLSTMGQPPSRMPAHWAHGVRPVGEEDVRGRYLAGRHSASCVASLRCPPPPQPARLLAVCAKRSPVITCQTRLPGALRTAPPERGGDPPLFINMHNLKRQNVQYFTAEAGKTERRPQRPQPPAAVTAWDNRARFRPCPPHPAWRRGAVRDSLR